MVPIMNVFLVLVPFLLMSASFIHIKAINASAPVLSSSSADKPSPKNKDIKVTVIAELKRNAIQLTLNADALSAKDVGKWHQKLTSGKKGQYPFSDFADYLSRLKAAYPASDTVVIIPDGKVLYDTIIKTMDAARKTDKELTLFPNVVLSGKVT